MKQQLARWLEKVWYQDPATGRWMVPLGLVYRSISQFRRFLYFAGVLKRHNLPVPVIVVGNITVGGTGKTPLIIWLAQWLKANGFKPGIISRGYGGRAETWPQRVAPDSDVKRVGDEALVIAKHAGCPIAVGPVRVEAAESLLKHEHCDVILSDDGLQHYAMARDIEIAVVDGERLFGNGRCLPAGPLREPRDRISKVDFVVVNGPRTEAGQFSMHLDGHSAVNLVSGEVKPLPAFAMTRCHAVAGIGNPGRFFKLLEAAGITFKAHTFPDHYAFQADDIAFNAEPVLMTEKDAVKCTAFATNTHWYVPVGATVEPGFADQLLYLLREKTWIKNC